MRASLIYPTTGRWPAGGISVCRPLVALLLLLASSAPVRAWTDPTGDVGWPPADIISGSANVFDSMVDLRVQFAAPPFAELGRERVYWAFDTNQDSQWDISLYLGYGGICPLVDFEAWLDGDSNTLRLLVPLSLISATGPFNYTVGADYGGSWGGNETTASFESDTNPPPSFEGVPLCTCGNLAITTGEECDDGNLIDGDGCDSNCTVTACGNGVITVGEQCDDGNLVDCDGCDSNCTVTVCGNCTQHPQETVKLILKQNLATKKGKAVWLSKVPGAVLPVAPPTSVGGTLVVTGVDESCSTPLPAAFWVKNPAGTLYKFRAWVVPILKLKKDKKLKVLARDSLIDLNDPAQGTVSVSLTIGTDRYCSVCTTPIKDEPGRFIATNCSAPTDCCPAVLPTTTTTSTSSATTEAPTTTTMTISTTTTTLV